MCVYILIVYNTYVVPAIPRKYILNWSYHKQTLHQIH